MAAEGDSSSAPVEFGNLAAMVALTSDALAAAAEALVEAARAMSDASGTFVIGDLTELSGGITNLTSAPSASDYRNNQETDSTSIGPLGQVGQHGSRCERGISATSLPEPPPTLVSSDSSKEVKLVPFQLRPGKNISGPQPSRHDAKDDILGLHDTFAPELNNKRDVLPSSLVILASSNGLETVPNPPSGNGRSSPQSILYKFFVVIKSYPPIPPGRNYIQVESSCDALAFIGFMARQNGMPDRRKRLLCQLV
ncbi:hypothetical protein B0J17DRAFT_229924 [Rhizoctonia solani]|nr:hypothetical protein B0J17DRAFT_229924 [Rhizoctonia solani]